MKLDRYKTHDIEIVIDRLKIDTHQDNEKRLMNLLIRPCITVMMY